MKSDTGKPPNSPLKRAVKTSSDEDDDTASFKTAISGSPSPSRTQNILIIPGVTPNSNGIPSSSNNPAQDASNQDEDESFLSTNPGTVLLLALLSFLFLLYLVYLQFPAVSARERQDMRVPMNLEQAKRLAIILDRYTEQHYWTVLFGFCLVYIFLQTFSVPGSIFLSIMSGFLFSFKVALFLVCFCSATGASGCYMLSWLLGRKFIQSRFPDEIRQWTEKVNEEREHLLNFMVFLRITPILPNWFINIAAPLIGVPLGIFWLGTFIGVAPPTVLAVQGGKTLNVMTSPSDHISWSSVITLGVIAIVALLPVLLRRRSEPNPAPT